MNTEFYIAANTLSVIFLGVLTTGVATVNRVRRRGSFRSFYSVVGALDDSVLDGLLAAYYSVLASFVIWLTGWALTVVLR